MSAQPEFLTRLDQIPPGRRVCLYGAGRGGVAFLRLLAASRPDVEVVSFVDDASGGRKEGLPVVAPDALATRPGRVDLVLITSTYWREIAASLGRRCPIPYLTVEPRLYFPEHVFDEAESRRSAELFAAARALLARPEDRALYDLVIATRDGRCEHAESPLALFSRSVSHPREYLDFINPEAVRHVVEGGVMDGRSTLSLLSLLPTAGSLHGFEPFIELYIESPWRARIESRPGCHIHPLALWERRDKLLFEIDPSNDAGGRILPGGEAGETRRWVEAVSLDEFVAEQELDRPDYIKLDIEGAEPEALRGARGVITGNRPQMAVCIYHRKEHLYEIPLYLDRLMPDYVHRLAHYSNSFWDTVWYSIPGETYRGLPPDPEDG